MIRSRLDLIVPHLRSTPSITPSPSVACPASQSPDLSNLRLKDSFSTDTVLTPLTRHHTHLLSSARPSSIVAFEPANIVLDLAPGQRDRNRRVVIEPDGTSWYPLKQAADALKESVRRLYTEAYHS